MPDFSAIMKQAQQMQDKLQEAQAKLAETVVEGSAGGGVVTVTLLGTGELKRVHINSSILSADEADVVADLVVAAHADAKKKLDAASADLMRDAAGPLAGKIPGLGFDTNQKISVILEA